MYRVVRVYETGAISGNAKPHIKRLKKIEIDYRKHLPRVRIYDFTRNRKKHSRELPNVLTFKYRVINDLLRLF